MTIDDFHRLVDELPVSTQKAAFRILQCLQGEKSELAAALVEDPDDPFLLALAAAPDDDEHESQEEAEAVLEAVESSKRGESIPWDEVETLLSQEGQ